MIFGPRSGIKVQSSIMPDHAKLLWGELASSRNKKQETYITSTSAPVPKGTVADVDIVCFSLCLCIDRNIGPLARAAAAGGPSFLTESVFRPVGKKLSGLNPMGLFKLN